MQLVKHRAALLRPASRWDSQPTGLLVERWGRSGMWCHVLLIMPLLGLGLFALLPWPVALPSYLVLVAVSLALYVKGIQAMRQPVRTGREAMLGAVVTVTRHAASQGQVRYRGELWSAVSEQRLTVGERARIVGFDGLRLVVRRLDDSQHRDKALWAVGHAGGKLGEWQVMVDEQRRDGHDRATQQL